MSKKKQVKKAVKKPVKASKKASSSKAKPAKAVKTGKPKSAGKPLKKTVAKKAAPKPASKKPIIKKAAPAKTVKKAVKTAVVKKNTKSAAPKKADKKVVLATLKTAKKKIAAPKKAQKIAKPQPAAKKPVDKAPAKPVKKAAPAPKKAVKPVVAEKPAKPIKAVEVKEPKPEKAKAPRRSKKSKKSGDDDDEPLIENDPLIEEMIRSTKKKTQPKKPKIIQTFVNPMAALSVAAPEGKKAAPKKEPKGKFELEYMVRTSAGILYEFLTSPSGLSEWFADDVNIRDGIFTFFWDGSEQKARLLSFKDEKLVRLQWLDKPEGTYFEFRIDKDELTGDTSLIITDFADEGSDLETSKLLWDSQVNKLLHVIGSY